MTKQNKIATIQQANPLINMRNDIDKRRPMLESVLPSGVTFDRFKQSAIFALTENPKLLQCEPASVIKAIMTAAQLGDHLGSAFNESYIYPRYDKNKGCSVAILHRGYRGLQRAILRSGLADVVRASVVYHNDIIDISEHPPRIEHKIDPRAADRGEWLGVLAAAYRLENGEHVLLNHVYITKQRVEVARKSQTRSQDIWNKHPEQMRLKVGIRALANEFQVMSEEQAQTLAQDHAEMQDATEGNDEQQQPEPAAKESPKAAKARKQIEQQAADLDNGFGFSNAGGN